MRARVFNNLVELCHREWLAQAIGIPSSTQNGVDLLDKDIGIELKARLRRYSPQGNLLAGNLRFAVHEYQVTEFPKAHPEVTLYWALMFYDLALSVKDLHRRDDLSDYITKREVWFFEWEWMKHFAVSSPETGPYRYPSYSHFPPKEEYHAIEVDGGKLFVPPRSLLRNKLTSIL